MAVQGLRDIIVGEAENRADAGGTIPRIVRSIILESGAVIEKAVRHARELHLASRGGDKRVAGMLDGMGRNASVPRARIEAAMRGCLGVGAVGAAAAECGLRGLLRRMG